MNMTAAVYSLAALNESAQVFAIRGDGHGSFQVELSNLELAQKMRSDLNQRKFVEYPIQLHEYALTYRLH